VSTVSVDRLSVGAVEEAPPVRLEEALRDPGQGIGKPERLTENLSGYWSRRITDEHRLVYTVRGENLIIVQERYHY
jgi:toxin YoeB